MIGRGQKSRGAKVRFGNKHNCQGVAKTNGLGTKMCETQKKRHIQGNLENMCKRNWGDLLNSRALNLVWHIAA